MKHIRADAIQRACKVVVEWKPNLGGSEPLGILISNEIEDAVRKAVAQAFEEAAKLCEEVSRNDTGGAAGDWCAERIRARAKETPSNG